MDADTNICAVILNYNDAQTTRKLTESWKNSKVIRNIIIVDNCSTDDSWEKLGEFKEEFASDHPDDPDKVQLHLSGQQKTVATEAETRRGSIMQSSIWNRIILSSQTRMCRSVTPVSCVWQML